MRSKRIIDITSKEIACGGADVSCHMNYESDIESAKTAVAKAMLFLNEFCVRRNIEFRLQLVDMFGDKLSIKFSEPVI